MSDPVDWPPPAEGCTRKIVATTHVELVTVGALFHEPFAAAVRAGLDPCLVWSAMSYPLAVEAVAMGLVPHMDEPLRQALPGFALGYRAATNDSAH